MGKIMLRQPTKIMSSFCRDTDEKNVLQSNILQCFPLYCFGQISVVIYDSLC